MVWLFGKKSATKTYYKTHQKISKFRHIGQYHGQQDNNIKQCTFNQGWKPAGHNWDTQVTDTHAHHSHQKWLITILSRVREYIYRFIYLYINFDVIMDQTSHIIPHHTELQMMINVLPLTTEL